MRQAVMTLPGEIEFDAADQPRVGESQLQRGGYSTVPPRASRPPTMSSSSAVIDTCRCRWN